MRILFRILQLFISPLIMPLAILAAVIYFLGETTFGLQTTLQMINRLIPGELIVQHAEGKLFSEITLNNISYRHAGTEVRIQFLDFHWEPKQLLEGKLLIKQLIFHDASIQLAASSNQAPAKFDLAKLKFYSQHVQANKIAIYNVAFSQPDKPAIHINEITLEQTDALNFVFLVKSSNGDIQGTFADTWNAHWNFQTADLGTLIPQVGGNGIITGMITGPRLSPTITANLNLKKLTYANQSIDSLIGKMTLILQPNTLSTLSLNVAGVKIQNYTFKKAQLAINSKTSKTQQNWITNTTVALDTKPWVTLTLSLPITVNMDNIASVPVYGKLNVNAVNVESLQTYLPVIKNLRGQVLGTVELKGSFKQPVFSGEVTLNHGNISIPELNITLKNIALQINSNAALNLHYTGSFDSAAGSATITGSTDFAAPDYPSSVVLRGKNLQVANLSEYNITVSPDLTLKLANHVLHLDGSIDIPEAKITPKNFSSVVTLSSDVVFVGAKKKSKLAVLDYLPALQVRLTLGEKIFLHYQDLEAKLKGSLLVSKEPNGPMTAVGELYATQGTYHAYKKILAIQEGRLVYTGNIITNPGLNIRATREMKTVQTSSISDFSTSQAYEGTQTLTVGVQVAGTMEKPVISLYSSPALSQVDVLSYLVLGIPSSQASGGNSQALLAAASALDVGSGASHLAAITSGLKKTLGLSELNVESVQSFDPSAGSVVGTTSIVVGKQLAENLSVHYSTSLNLLNPVSTFNLRYKLSKRFSIQSETSTIDTGADLLYSIERD